MTVAKKTNAAKGFEKASATAQEQIEAALKAGTDSFKGYEDMVAFGKENLDALMASGSIFAKGFQDLNSAWFGLAQASLEDSFAATQAVMKCKSVPEAVEVQRELAKDKVARIVTESRKLSEMSVKLAEKALEPITGRVNVAVEKFSKPLAV